LREDQRRITRFELVQREGLAMLLVATALLLLSTFAPAPLAATITASAPVIETTRAPWFFLWVQQMLKMGNPFFSGVVVPLAVLVLISLIPYIFPKPAKPELGRWFPKSNRLAQAVALFILLAIITLTLLALLPIS
jgi:quinol-cytochrome oxidoreductase complex cytochrome b subunit